MEQNYTVNRHANLPQIATERLLMRPLAVDDAGILYAAIDSSRLHLARRMDWASESTPEHVTEHLLQTARWDGTCSVWIYGIFLTSGELIGSISLENWGPSGSTAELGYWMHVRQLNRGYMTEAARAFTARALEVEPPRTLWAHIQPENLASLHVADRCGFKYHEKRFLRSRLFHSYRLDRAAP